MGFGYVVVAAGVAAGCYFGYRKLKQIEEEIREELKAKGLAAEEEVAINPEPVVSSKQKVEEPPPAGEISMEGRIQEIIRRAPGIMQTALYAEFPDAERKAVQAALLKMSKAGVVLRTKEKSTYRLELP